MSNAAFKHPSVLPPAADTVPEILGESEDRPVNEEWLSENGDLKIETKMRSPGEPHPYCLEFSVQVGSEEKSVTFTCSRSEKPDFFELTLLCARIHSEMLLLGEKELYGPQADEVKASRALARGIDFFYGSRKDQTLPLGSV